MTPAKGFAWMLAHGGAALQYNRGFTLRPRHK